jgi:hypothetical protein
VGSARFTDLSKAHSLLASSKPFGQLSLYACGRHGE